MKKTALFAIALLAGLLTVSCNKEKEGGKVTPTQLSVEVKDVLEIYEIHEKQSATLSLQVAADPVSEESYTLTLSAKQALVTTYNSKNGTSYKMLPSAAYTLSSSSLMLTKYSPKSTSCELRLKGEGCEVNETYVLPVAVSTVQGGTNYEAPDDKAAYILFKMLPPEGGSGTEADPYIVKDMESFNKISNMIRDEDATYFKMTADLDFSAVTFTEENPWTPINSVAADDENALPAALARKIYFDGDGHKIINFKAGGPLFGVFVGSVRNLVIENAEIEGSGNDAAIIAEQAGSGPEFEEIVAKNVKIVNSKVYTDYKRAGSLFSWLRGGIVEDCTADCPVSANQQAGGLIGRVESGSIVNCSASGDVTTEVYYAGGLVGIVSVPAGTTDVLTTVNITGCHATGNVTSKSGNYTRGGGLVGEIQTNLNVENCYATGNVTGTGHFAGGLLGPVVRPAELTKTIVLSVKKSYATGNVTLPTSGNFAHGGGLLSSVYGANVSATIENCYATGTIVVRRYSGGFIGTICNGADTEVTVTNCYTTSNIDGVAIREGLALGQLNGAVKSLVYKGFVGWNPNNKAICYDGNDPQTAIPADGNYFGSEGTVSQQATKLGWDTGIWDLSGDLPKLK
ncbi:MAG: DUF1735 domain-containing protein [Bacteroidales bacterium]|nr:DUF1735 domain-containing protein [Bacteroidales bacterium]